MLKPNTQRRLFMRQLLSLMFVICASSAPLAAFAYGWAQGQDGVDYCYPTDANGNVPGGVGPADFSYCHRYAVWGYDGDGSIYCFSAEDRLRCRFQELFTDITRSHGPDKVINLRLKGKRTFPFLFISKILGRDTNCCRSECRFVSAP